MRAVVPASASTAIATALILPIHSYLTGQVMVEAHEQLLVYFEDQALQLQKAYFDASSAHPAKLGNLTDQ